MERHRFRPGCIGCGQLYRQVLHIRWAAVHFTDRSCTMWTVRQTSPAPGGPLDRQALHQVDSYTDMSCTKWAAIQTGPALSGQLYRQVLHTKWTAEQIGG